MGVKIILWVLVYFALWPTVISLSALTKNLIKREFKRRMRIKSNNEERKPSLLSRIGESSRFTLKTDKRETFNVRNSFIFIGIYALGLILTILSVIIDNSYLLIVAVFLPILAWIFATIKFRPIKKKREVLFERIYTLKRDRMGLVERGNKDGSFNYGKEFEVLKWDDTYMFPKKISITIPTKFDELQIESFMTQFNLYFGAGSKWAPDRSNPENPGWNFTEGLVTLVHTPPLPRMAAWDAKYLLNDEIAWSFFPMALGSENGVKVTTDEGEEQFVLGFDLAGEQAKLARKNGGQVGEEVVLAPQVLIAGGTGGGKALNSNTEVHRIIEKDKNS